MAKKIEAKEGFVEVTRTMLGKQTEKVAKIKVRPFVTDTAYVSVKKGATIPTGDYSSARVDVMIGMPCYVSEVPEMFQQVNALVEKLIDREVSIIQGGDQ
jgi:hypothetical protein